jgi:hypothetical protein
MVSGGKGYRAAGVEGLAQKIRFVVDLLVVEIFLCVEVCCHCSDYLSLSFDCFGASH